MTDADNPSSPRRVFVLLAAGLFVSGSLALWRWTPLREWTDPAALQRVLEEAATQPAHLAIAWAVMVLLTCLGFPLLVLATAAGATWAPWLALPLCMACLMISAWIGFELGRLLPIGASQGRLAHRVGALRELAERSSTWGMALLRNVPIAPFAWVNLACGSLGVPRPAYLLGTWLGTLPPLTLVCFFGSQLREWIDQPSGRGLAGLALPLGLLVCFAVLARWAYAERRRGKTLNGGTEHDRRPSA